MSKIKIVATIGPATACAEMLTSLNDAGMSVARLNGSHADLKWHKKTIKLIQKTLPEVPILLDIPGKKIRTAELRCEPTFEVGDQIVLTTNQDYRGTKKVLVNSQDLHLSLGVNSIILADDGTLRFSVVKIEGHDIMCCAEVSGKLRSHKGINVPSVKISGSLVTKRDRIMIDFASENDVDFIGISFVESAQHVHEIRKLLDKKSPQIVSKIENRLGMENMQNIISATDIIMIDRGDLSVETELESLAIFQKSIIDNARDAGKPVIVATEMLHTMISNPFPTKAEVSDITNAVIDGCAATMLSGETAVGHYPEASILMMRKIVDQASEHVQSILTTNSEPKFKHVSRGIEEAIALICRELEITKIVAITISGYAARILATHRPRQPILAVSNDPMAVRRFNILPGTEGVYIDIPFPKDNLDHILVCLEELWKRNKLTSDDLVLITAVGYPKSGRRMNLIQTHHIRDLEEMFGWSKNL